MAFNTKNLIYASSKRPHNMSLVYGDTKDALGNRKEFLKELGIDYRLLVCAKQVHGSGVSFIQEDDSGRGALSYDNVLEDTDALITNKSGIPLAVFTADCLAVFLYDPVTNSIAIVHAGWRSSREKIAVKTVSLMRERFGTRPEDLYAGFSPLIRECCYEVGEEFLKFFPGNTTRRQGKYYFDLAGQNKEQLKKAGLWANKISDPEICTSCRSIEYFSFRKEGKSCGRMMSVIMLK